MKFFKNKVVWITGASSGIGEALAYTFARHGSKLILSARREGELQRVKKACDRNDEDILVLPMDVSNSDQATDLYQHILARFGTVDILINNAGLSHWSKVKDLSMEVTRKILDVNFFGGVALVKTVLPGMIERKSGHIVVISSVLGKMPVMKQAAYVASKHAIQGFYDTLRLEVAAEGVNVLIVCPGFVNTNVAKNSLDRDGIAINKNNDKIANGLDPICVSERILNTIVKNKSELIIAGTPEKTAITLKRLFPSLFNRFMQKRRLI